MIKEFISNTSGELVKVKREHIGGCYEVDAYEITDEGEQVYKDSYLMTAGEIKNQSKPL